jgi:Putative DNA-binding domain
VFFTPHANDITVSDLLQLSGQQEEGERWEFKGAWIPAKDIAKAVTAFSNTAGGYLLIGVEEDGAGVAQAVTGVPARADHNEFVQNACGHIQPRVIPQVKEIELDNGNVVAVIYVPVSQHLPHMSMDNKYYMRAERQSTPMSESIVDRLYVARHAEEEQVDEFLESVNWGIRPCDATQYHWLSLFAMPLQASREVIPSSRAMWDFLDKLKPVMLSSYMGYRRNSFHGFVVDVTSSGRVERSFDLRHNGFLSAGYSPELSEQRGIPYGNLIFAMPEFIRIAYEIYQHVGYHSFLRLGLVLGSVTNTRLTSQHGTSLVAYQEPPNVDPLVITRDCAVDDLVEDMFDLSKFFFLRVAQSYGLQVFDLGPGELEGPYQLLSQHVKSMQDWTMP